MKKVVSICFLIYLLLPNDVHSQTQVEKGFELQEVLQIAEMYKNISSLSFNLDYTYTDSLEVDSVLEHLAGSVKVSNGRYYTILDSVEYIQGYQYNLTVFHKDSAIVVNDRGEYVDVMKIPVLDSLFNSNYVDSIKIYSDDTASTNKVYVYLSSNSPYSNYVLTYDRTSYQITGIQFYIKNVPTDEGVSSGTALLKIVMSNYSTNEVSQEIFWEDRFIYIQNGELHVKPMFIGYQLLDNTTIKPGLPQ